MIRFVQKYEPTDTGRNSKCLYEWMTLRILGNNMQAN